MSETVWILGAGASREANGPLMSDFVDRARDLVKSGEVEDAERSFDLVFRGIDALQLAQSKASIGLVNIESVFAAFEMARLTGALGSLRAEEVEQLPDAMVRVIALTLERSIKFPVDQGSNAITPPAPYGEFAKLAASSQPDIITLNYDLCLDYSMHYHNVRVDYCLDGSADPRGVKLLKLHGSLNWAYCEECGLPRAYTIGEFLARKIFRPGMEGFVLAVASGIHQAKPCAGCKKPASLPMVVPPTWNKTQYHARLRSVWAAAALALREAENIIVTGYSLPETDQFFRYLYALGTMGDARLRRFWVFDPDPSVEHRFEELLGPQGKERFTFHRGTFRQAIINCQEF